MAKILELGENGVFHRKQEGLLMTRELDNNRFVPYPFRVLGGSADEINSVGDSVEVPKNTPRLDFKKKYVPPTDNSFYNFDGVNDKIALPNPTGSVVVNPFSVAIKFKTGSDISTAQVIYSNVFDSSNRFSLAINNGYFVFSTYDGTFNDKS